MKRVAILVNSLKQGGAEKVAILLYHYLYKKFDINLLLLEKKFFYKSHNKIFLLKNISRFKFINFFFKVYKLKKFVKKNNIKVVQSHLLKANYINILSKLIGSSHEVQIVNHSLIDRFENTLKGKIHIFMMKILYKYADVSISVSKNVEMQLEKYVNLPNKRYIIYNPIDIEFIRNKMKEEITDFTFVSSNFYLIMVGRINSIKKIDLVIKALNIIKNHNLHLILIGEEEDVKVKDLLKISYFPHNIHYLGVKINPYKYIHKSHLLIVASESESFGNVIVESMACGTPVISSDCGGPREIIAPNSNLYKNLEKGNDIEVSEYGILFPKNDIDGLIKSINVLINNKKLYYNYKIKGLERAKDFDIKNIVKKYERILNRNET